MKNQKCEVRFYMNGDESGKLYRKHFDCKHDMNQWLEGMGSSIELFSAEEID